MAEKETDIKKIERLIELMKINDLVEIEIVDGGNKIMLKRPQPVSPVITQVPIAPVAAPVEVTEKAETESEQKGEDEGLVEITSPIIGTFYSAASPESEPYVAVDSRVEADTVVCIVEAMKVMNEIKAEASGTIVEVLCKTGEAVEYGQVIFKLRPD